MFILWNHISATFYEDRECCFTHHAKTSKLTYQVDLLLIKMNVRLAAQVLSSVSKVLLACSPLEAAETAHFCSSTFKITSLLNLNENQC